MTVGSRLLALDVGGKRIGVAISDELGMIASPLTMIPRQSDVVSALKTLIQQYSIGALIVGMPVGLSGREGPQAQETRAFIAEIEPLLDVPIDVVDERLSSAIAEQALIAQGTRREKRKDHIDAMAAAVILQSFLDGQKFKATRRRR